MTRTASPLPGVIRRVVVVGGTHGNEFVGAFLARHWRANPAEIARPGLEVEALVANERAVAEVRRYVDKDLNRCFRTEDLARADGGGARGHEEGLAPSLRDRILAGHPPAEVAVFDLHTTTAHMGKSLVLGTKQPFAMALAAHVEKADPEVRAYCWVEHDEDGSPREPGFISAVAPAGVAFEVGPIANGVLDARIVAATRSVVASCLEFVERWNAAVASGPAGPSALLDEELLLYEHRAHVDYPRGSDGAPIAMIHPDRQGRDYAALAPGDPLFITFEGRSIPYEGPPGRVALFINEAAYYEKGIALTLTEPLRGPARSFAAGPGDPARD